ncbi:MAG: DUF4340 domain-containing protein [Sedimentisphaerales bacterium]|nr:DUF4340 domain-containing protein [Sedimentisphaerales bacterium]
MTNRQLMVLGLIAACAVICAIALSYISNMPTTEPNVPMYLIQGLAPEDIYTIVLGSGDDEVILKRQQGRFVVASKDNYPAITSEVNRLISACLDIKTVEFYTDDKQNFKALGLTEEDAGNVIKFLKPDSSPLTGVIIGNNKKQGQGTFVRLISSDKVYVAAQNPRIKGWVLNYIDQQLLSLGREDIESVTVRAPNEVYTLRINQEDIVLEDIPAEKKLKDKFYERVFEALTSLSFTDVMSTSSANDLDFTSQFVCRLKDSTVYTLNIAEKAEKTYIICKAEFADGNIAVEGQTFESHEQAQKADAKLLASNKAREFSAKHQGWVYEIASYKAENLTKKLSELTEDK